MIGEAFKFIWDTAKGFLSWELDFGDVSFQLWHFAVGSIALLIMIYLVRGFFSRGE